MDFIRTIKNKEENILIGEIGALLHDIGKNHPSFIKKQSLEGGSGEPSHTKINEFIDDKLIQCFKDDKLEIKLNEKVPVYDLIVNHHSPNKKIIEYLQVCDRKDSADDKGIVRKKQSIQATIISSPFGYPKEKIDLQYLEKRFEDLQDVLLGLFREYIDDRLPLTHFRRLLLENLKVAFSHALGETRIPANDVTLWDHSFSTASLFKSILCRVALDDNPEPGDVHWRLLGFCWDGITFTNKGRKTVDILKRKEIVEKVKNKLKSKFEDEIPIGNAIYEDINGIYFTLPALDYKNKKFAKTLVKIGLKIIKKESNGEIWPFFTLSEPSKALTVLANELKFASSKRVCPKITPTPFDNPNMTTPQEGEDICPFCKLRTKPTEKERCRICDERMQGRLKDWINNRKDTVWIDEVADENNRIALISLKFDLDKWLDGTMIETIYSQTHHDWLKEFAKNKNKVMKKIEDKIRRLGDTITNMKKAKDPNRVKQRIESKKIERNDLYKKLELLNSPRANIGYIQKIIENFLFKEEDEEIKITILDTFLNAKSSEESWNNIKDKTKHSDNKVKDTSKIFFIQNASPSRLYRTWKETEEFFDLIINEIKDKIYHHKWKRINFSINPQELENSLKDEYKDIKKIEKVPLIIKIKGLNPEPLLVFHNRNGEFYTIESLEKFKFNDKIGEEAVKKAIERGIEHLALEDKPDENLLNKNKRIEAKIAKHEEYCPLIEINKFPLSLRFIAPALDSMKIIEMITRLYNKRFEKSIGKVPLNVKLLVAKRKFPLYILLDAEKRMLENEEFKKQTPMNPWWEPDTEEHYGFYPTNPINGEKYTLDDLSPLSKGKIFYLYPGYFDFELLSATTNRYNIYYEGEKRGHEDHRLFSGRPYYFYQILQIIELWDILSNNLSSSQINFIEEALTSKLREWRNVKDKNKQEIFRKFAEATLKNAFEDKWDKLRDETKFFLISSALNRLLLDTINLFVHVTKRGA